MFIQLEICEFNTLKDQNKQNVIKFIWNIKAQSTEYFFFLMVDYPTWNHLRKTSIFHFICVTVTHPMEPIISLLTKRKMYLSKIIYFHWSIIELQGCVSFRYIAKWFSHIHIFFQVIFHYKLLQDTDYSSLRNTINLCCFLCMYGGLHLVIPCSLSFPLSLSPLVTVSLLSMSASLLLCCIQIHLYYFLDSTQKWYHIIFAFLSLTYFS